MGRGKKFYSTGEVARLFGVTAEAVWHWCKDGRVKAVKTPGGQYRIPAAEVERLLNEAKGE